MKLLYPLARALLLSAALLFGQQAVALHALVHAQEQLAKKDAKPGSSSCELCATCAQLAGALGATPPSLPPIVASHAQFEVAFAEDTAVARLLAFQSRAPPALL